MSWHLCVSWLDGKKVRRLWLEWVSSWISCVEKREVPLVFCAAFTVHCRFLWSQTEVRVRGTSHCSPVSVDAGRKDIALFLESAVMREIQEMSSVKGCGMIVLNAELKSVNKILT